MKQISRARAGTSTKLFTLLNDCSYRILHYAIKAAFEAEMAYLKALFNRAGKFQITITNTRRKRLRCA